MQIDTSYLLYQQHLCFYPFYKKAEALFQNHLPSRAILSAKTLKDTLVAKKIAVIDTNFFDFDYTCHIFTLLSTVFCAALLLMDKTPFTQNLKLCSINPWRLKFIDTLTNQTLNEGLPFPCDIDLPINGSPINNSGSLMFCIIGTSMFLGLCNHLLHQKNRFKHKEYEYSQ